MKTPQLVLIAVLLLGDVSSLSAGGTPEPSEPSPDQVVVGAMLTLTGTLSVKGNEPFTFLALTTPAERVYQLEGELVEGLRGRQYQRVRLRGEVLSKALPGMPARVRVVEELPSQ